MGKQKAKRMQAEILIIVTLWRDREILTIKTKKMYRTKITKSKLTGITAKEGETIESKMRRILNNKEPITEGAPLLYTDRKDGIKPEYNIKTDKMEVALDAMTKVAASKRAKSNFNLGERTFDTMTPEQQAKHIETYPQSKFNKPNEGTA